MTLRRLTTERSAKIILFMLLFAMAFRISADSDVWWHLRLGQQIVESGEAVYADQFSYTRAGEMHHNHSALAQVILYLAWHAAGHIGLSLYVAIMALAALAFVYRAGAGSSYLQGFVLVIGATTASAFWSPRPQMFSFLFAAILLCLLNDFKRGRGNRLWLVIPLMWIWSNAHAGYIFGYALLGAYAVGGVINSFISSDDGDVATGTVGKIALVSIASLPFLVLNPLGLSVYAVPFRTLVLPELRRYIAEWQPPDFAEPITWAFVLLTALVIVAMWASRRRLDATEWLLLFGSGGMALAAARNLSLFALIAMPIATGHLNQALNRLGWVIPRRELETPLRLAFNLLLIGLVASGLALYARQVMSSNEINKALSTRLPIAAVDHLKSAHIEGKMFNSYNWGGYLIFHLPQFPVFIDGRTDLYAGFLDDYYEIATAGDDWQVHMQRWQIGFALIETESGLTRALAADDAWKTTYQDPLASIFARESSDER